MGSEMCIRDRQYSGDWKDLRLNLNVSDGDRKMLNGIWDYYANKR